MAFLRKEKKASGTYLRLVESYRDDNGKPKHKTICNLGKAEDYSKKTLKTMGQIFLELSGEKKADSINDYMKELSRLNYGFPLVYDRVMKHYELDKLLRNIGERHHLEFDLYRNVLLMLLERLNDPSSKLSNYHHQDEYLGFGDLQLHHLYRSLDRLSENQDKIQELIYSKGRHLFNQKLDVVFYDVTTFYFESEKEDEFRRKGFCKDGKIGKTTIVFGMLIDKDKNPVGYQIYRGGFYEGHTFADALKKLKEDYEIEKVITVADRGMMNKNNISMVENDVDYEYIIGERFKNLPKKIQAKLLDRSRYTQMEITDDASGETEKIDCLVIEYGGRRLIATYSAKRAAKDRYDRQQRIDKGMKMAERQWEIEKNARRHYLKKSGSNSYEINEDKINSDALYDGLVCIATNNRELNPAEVLSSYRHLYKIEQTFRTFKTYLETRPMFHWTEKRIEGHLCLCYIAFTLLNYLEKRLRGGGLKQSEEQIRKKLSKMQLSLIERDGEKFYLRSNLTDEMKKILSILKLKRIPDFTESKALSQYIPEV